jgi:hypothetical protein
MTVPAPVTLIFELPPLPALSLLRAPMTQRRRLHLPQADGAL